ncbi:MAG: tripartite tricarboxylate transporter TctB family protein [Desulfovibrio sp.]|nr:tripartite tricarboxylate transporter TctB family protein [Desulfovibrio sp.]
MTRSDIGIVAIIYATCLLFLIMTLKLKAAAQVYPLCLIAGLALLNTLYLASRLWRLFTGRTAIEEAGIEVADAAQEAEKHGLVNDLPEIFTGFVAGQFFFVVIASVAYLALMRYVGFYPAGLVYMVAVMWRLKVPPLHMAVTLAVLGVLIYAVFTLFLKVPLPRGILFS